MSGNNTHDKTKMPGVHGEVTAKVGTAASTPQETRPELIPDSTYLEPSALHSEGGIGGTIGLNDEGTALSIGGKAGYAMTLERDIPENEVFEGSAHLELHDAAVFDSIRAAAFGHAGSLHTNMDNEGVGLNVEMRTENATLAGPWEVHGSAGARVELSTTDYMELDAQGLGQINENSITQQYTAEVGVGTDTVDFTLGGAASIQERNSLGVMAPTDDGNPSHAAGIDSRYGKGLQSAQISLGTGVNVSDSTRLEAKAAISPLGTNPSKNDALAPGLPSRFFLDVDHNVARGIDVGASALISPTVSRATADIKLSTESDSSSFGMFFSGEAGAQVMYNDGKSAHTEGAGSTLTVSPVIMGSAGFDF